MSSPSPNDAALRYIPSTTWTNATRSPIERTLNDVFKEHVLQRPDAPAVAAHDGSYTYRELDEQSDALADELHRQGVTTEVVVALLFEKSKLIIVALFAVIKAGGAILLCDPDLPIARLQDIIDDSGAYLTISSKSTASRAAALTPRQYVLNAPLPRMPPQPASEHKHRDIPRPNNALYSVFTSGSTGKPKGFLMEHRALLTCALPFGKALNLTPNSRTLQFSSNSFDLANFEHLLPFVFGACLCIPSDAERKNDLNGALRKYLVSAATMTPSVSRLLEPETLPLLKTLMLCGEPVTPDDIRRFAPHVALYDGYSPAEAGCITIMNGAKSEACPANIGSSLGVLPWVVDPDDCARLRGVGETGELVIQGHTVARGYFGPVEKSAGSFIAPPAWVSALGCEGFGALYKTGDLVRYEADGSLVFLGRKDTQVKLHGQRLEPGEIEARLRAFFPMPQAVVVELVEMQAGSPMLLAFVCPTPYASSFSCTLFQTPDAAFQGAAQAALAGLRDVLPSYMVPSDILLVSHVPMLPSGKTDRRSLRDAAGALSSDERRAYSSTLDARRDQPSTELETTLRAQWASCLKIAVDQIGVEDNFFSLGGSSLDAMHLAARARKLGFNALSSAAVFRHPTVRSLARHLADDATGEVVSVEPFTLDSEVTSELLRKTQLELDELEGGWIPTTAFQQKSAQLKCMHIVVNVAGLDHSLLEEAWAKVQQSHMALRSVYVLHEGTVYQAFLRQAQTKIPIHYCANQSPDDYATAYSPQDAEPILTGQRWFRIIRASTSTPDNTDSALIIRTTHAQFDAMTLTAIFTDLMAAYNDQTQKNTLCQHEHEPEHSPFNTYMQWRLAHNRSPAHFSFWKQYLAGAQLTTPRLTDPSAPVDKESTAMVVAMKPVRTRSGSALTPPAGITLATMFRAAWALVLSRHTGETDLVFGEFVEGRMSMSMGAFSSSSSSSIAAEIAPETVTGCTGAETPMRIVVPQDPTATVLDLLAHAQEQYVRRVPYETCELRDVAAFGAWDAPQPERFNHVLVVESAAPIPAVEMGDRECGHRWVFHGRLEDVYVQLVPGEEVRVVVLGPEVRVAQGVAEDLVGRLAEMLGVLGEMPKALLSEVP
ncbi:nonribosomal peptide synthetase fmqC [Aspergillus mulundensis]|uniref:Carrier domain-containing protein n=1 Tax=Aspergillus mulundensis TaxID=1810919 RepID=A0A3D8T361_9EURO|nr:hypothetical protein DSM5745_00292 [Aspergillus mulundensis]RDW92970.1 hypothetical protein DSM5745_00292 [Aspergillus mulundensis]